MVIDYVDQGELVNDDWKGFLIIAMILSMENFRNLDSGIIEQPHQNQKPPKTLMNFKYDYCQNPYPVKNS